MEETDLKESTLEREDALKEEFGPILRAVAKRYFTAVRFPPEAVGRLADLHKQGFIVHVMRTSGWVNYLYLTWTLLRRGLPPIRAVANVKQWLTRPWRRTAQRGSFEFRFGQAKREGGSGLIFLREAAFGQSKGKTCAEDPFPALVAMARKGDQNVFLVPELFVWEQVHQRLKSNIWDYMFGSPEAPTFLYSLIAFWRNYHRAQFRIGEPIDVKRFISENPHASDVLIARKLRTSLYVHLAQETRAVFGPPQKPTERLIDETLRDRVLRRNLDEVVSTTGRSKHAVYRDARKALRQIAAKLSPTVVALTTPILNWVFNRIYEGIEVDEEGLDRAMLAAKRVPIILTPSHKSHIDYLILSYVFWEHGYQVPLVAAGANLSFWPLGPYLRRGGAFFMRRSFKGDKIYTAAFRGYIKKLIFDGVHQEFFPEGGRSRTGKLLEAKLGLITWAVDAVLEGARDDLAFLPVAIDYEKVVESDSYSQELAGGEKKPEDLKGLLTTPKILTKRYGRIYLRFEKPIFLSEVLHSRGISIREGVTDDQKRRLVRGLGNQIMYGISRVSTVTPYALVAAALLGHRRRGITAREVAERIGILRGIAEEDGVPLSLTLKNAPSDPTVLGAMKDAMSSFVADKIVKLSEAKGEVIYQIEDVQRPQLLFSKNTLVNLVAGRSLVAMALLSQGGDQDVSQAHRSALFLSRLFKFEFIYETGQSFDLIFEKILEKFLRQGLIIRRDKSISVAPETYARQHLEFLAEIIRDYLESYLITCVTMEDFATMPQFERKAFVKATLETGRAKFLEGKIACVEALTKTNIENAVKYLVDQAFFTTDEKLLRWGSKSPEDRRQIISEINRCLRQSDPSQLKS